MLRRIVRKSERQGKKTYDVLVCKHAVPVSQADRINTFRRFRFCPTCRISVQKYKDTHARTAPAATAARKVARA